jgi:hypothetical protein
VTNATPSTWFILGKENLLDLLEFGPGKSGAGLLTQFTFAPPFAIIQRNQVQKLPLIFLFWIFIFELWF